MMSLRIADQLRGIIVTPGTRFVLAIQLTCSRRTEVVDCSPVDGNNSFASYEPSNADSGTEAASSSLASIPRPNARMSGESLSSDVTVAGLEIR